MSDRNYGFSQLFQQASAAAANAVAESERFIVSKPHDKENFAGRNQGGIANTKVPVHSQRVPSLPEPPEFIQFCIGRMLTDPCVPICRASTDDTILRLVNKLANHGPATLSREQELGTARSVGTARSFGHGIEVRGTSRMALKVPSVCVSGRESNRSTPRSSMSAPLHAERSLVTSRGLLVRSPVIATVKTIDSPRWRV